MTLVRVLAVYIVLSFLIIVIIVHTCNVKRHMYVTTPADVTVLAC